jgi:predicted DCC family thiol-disulfide oxidoreductase YuxK
MPPQAPEIKVYYNSACPVCNAGITSQRDKMASCQVQWKDINSDATAIHEIPSELEFARERLHAIDENGVLKIGLEAFEVIWRHSPKERWKPKVISLPVVKPILILVYNLFARLLYAWNVKRGHWQRTL